MNKKKLAIFIGMVFFTSIYLAFMSLFITAFLHPSKLVIVVIDKYGEANFEMIMLLFSIPFVLFVSYWLVKEMTD